MRWDPNRENQQHFRQSVLLYTNYYYVRIQIHRSFIPRKSSLLSFPSLIICTSAARSCSNIIDVMRKRQLEVVPFVQVRHCWFSWPVKLQKLWLVADFYVRRRPVTEFLECEAMRSVDWSSKRDVRSIQVYGCLAFVWRPVGIQYSEFVLRSLSGILVGTRQVDYCKLIFIFLFLPC